MSDIDVDAFLEHYGVKGMKWGVRRARTPGVSRRVDRDAAKDAREFVNAKQYYGQGAGNRRKLINKTVEQKSSTTPGYKKAFDNHVKNQDWAKASTKAVKDRTKTDRRDRNKKRAGAIARNITGEWGTQAAFVALASTGIAFVNSEKGRAIMNDVTTKVQNSQAQKAGAAYLSDYFKRNG